MTAADPPDDVARGVSQAEHLHHILPPPGRQTVLVADDSPVVMALLIATLGSEFEILAATDGREAMAIAINRMPDLIMLDVLMPEFDGFEVCQKLKLDERTRNIPVIFLTGLEAAEDEMRGLELGAIDFIAKPIEPRIVALRVRNHLELKRYRDFLENLSLIDGLTGIGNRRRLDEALEREWRRARRVEVPLSMAMLDVDHFKRFNDFYGHAEGDNCLRQVAAVLQKMCKRPADLVARFGGEEFALIMPQTTRDGAILVAERVRASVAELRIPHNSSDAAPFVTVSIGVATVTPKVDTGPETLTRLADEKLYEAKRNGRNRVC
jgi:diguanylate cyclase (GGDEF)-like protein